MFSIVCRVSPAIPPSANLRGSRKVADLARQVKHIADLHRIRKRQLHFGIRAVVLDFEFGRRHLARA